MTLLDQVAAMEQEWKDFPDVVRLCAKLREVVSSMERHLELYPADLSETLQQALLPMPEEKP